jgi:lysyl-tRNA synthetase class 2
VHWLLDAYQHHIVRTGRELLFLVFIGVVGSFLFIRFSTRMIRAQVKWWPGNVTPGGLHLHHVVFGLVFLLIGGIGNFAIRGEGRPYRELLALLFGIGIGLVLDEFALILHLEDVYWLEEGRRSLDAVLLSVLFIGLLLIGEVPLGGRDPNDTHWLVVAGWIIALFLVVITLLKGKVWTALLGIMIPLFVVVGAIRLARPGSVWARWRYEERPKRLARAERREARWHGRFDRFRIRTMDLIAGAPSKPSDPVEPSPTGESERPPPASESDAVSAGPPESAVTRDSATP